MSCPLARLKLYELCEVPRRTLSVSAVMLLVPVVPFGVNVMFVVLKIVTVLGA